MQLLSIINASIPNILLRTINTSCPNSAYEYIPASRIYVDQAKEGQIKTCKMEQTLAVEATSDHVDRVKNYPTKKRILCH